MILKMAMSSRALQIGSAAAAAAAAAAVDFDFDFDFVGIELNWWAWFSKLTEIVGSGPLENDMAILNKADQHRNFCEKV